MKKRAALVCPDCRGGGCERCTGSGVGEGVVEYRISALDELRSQLFFIAEIQKGCPRLRYLWWRFVRRWDGEICRRCGRSYFASLGDTWWWADDELWQTVEGQPHGIRCPRCFTLDARSRGITVYWQPVLDTQATAKRSLPSTVVSGGREMGGAA